MAWNMAWLSSECSFDGKSQGKCDFSWKMWFSSLKTSKLANFSAFLDHTMPKLAYNLSNGSHFSVLHKTYKNPDKKKPRNKNKNNFNTYPLSSTHDKEHRTAAVMDHHSLRLFHLHFHRQTLQLPPSSLRPLRSTLDHVDASYFRVVYICRSRFQCVWLWKSVKQQKLVQ